jgi:hypothetical protein
VPDSGLVGAALVPAAPLFLDRVTAVLPADLATMRETIAAVLRRTEDADVVVCVAAADRPGVHPSAHADLAGLGRPDVVGDLPVPVRAVRAVTEATGLGRVAGSLPLDLAVLTLHLRSPVLPIAVDADADAATLAATGRQLLDGLGASGMRAAVVAAGDGSAGLSARAPRPAAHDAQAWQDAFEAAVGDLGALSALGPVAASRAAASGWAPAVVLTGACAAAGLGLTVTARAAPRGVGYVVAVGDTEPARVQG